MACNVLIFRTDRLGDLLFSCPTIFSIKNNIKNCRITLIASNKNYDYAKSLGIFSEIFMFDRRGLIKKIKFIRKLSKIKYDYVLVLDGKDRSIISSLFIKSQNKAVVIPESKLNFFWKLFNIKFVSDNERSNIIETQQKIMDLCHMNISINYFNFLTNKKDNNFSSKVALKNYVLVHLDEKWITNLYIKDYTDINISYNEFIKFISNISQNNNVLITSGIVDFALLDNLKKNFKKQDEKIFHKIFSNYPVYFIYKPTFDDIESLLRKAKFLISCHGAITHAANSLNVKILDIIEKNKINWYQRFSLYLRHYKPIFRSNFNLLSKEILKHL